MMRFLILCIAATATVRAFAPSLEAKVQTSISTTKSPVALDGPSFAKSSALAAVLERTELPEKLYMPKEKETPKVLGGLKIGLRELVVVTGASSGLGLQAAKTLARSGKYFVVMACRDVEKAKQGKYKYAVNLPSPLVLFV